ncbi:phospholipase A2 inhibitor and Ly6/PLAUR domain-containing protein-like [Dendropsophus ebraccatus]|uniref:phospholipase A2 inhibitor and Ly6/PLAUR domain-containing protein-like n=1 Tax=Dendropsophus ebraccatus TaxID=150705 RepID=UPI0038314569
MTSLTGILSLLSALIATSYALTCSDCMSTSSSLCLGTSVTCSSGYQCGAEHMQTTSDGKTFDIFSRSCMPPSHCNTSGSITLHNGQIKMVTACCITDNCSPIVSAFPTLSNKTNGVVCRSCLSTNSSWCYTKEKIHCTGDENMCILHSTKVKGKVSGSTSFRGCATKSFCDFGSQFTRAEGTSTKVQYICTSGGKSVHQVLLAPAITSLLLLKLFF